jgi:phosphatidate cytidylyltransferase
VRTRIIAGLIAIPIVVIPIYLGGFWGLLLGVAATTIGAWELFHMFKAGGYQPSLWIGMPWAILIFMAGWDPEQVQRSSISITGFLTQPTIWIVETFSFPLQTVLTAGLIITLIYCLFVVDKPVNTWMATSIGAIYLGILLGQIVALRFLPNGFWYVLFGFLVTWANDTAAYFTGVTIGRRKLWPRLSPKKTWEGTLGGWIGAAAAGALLAWLFPLDIGPLYGAAIGFLAGILGLFGDLSISMIKRQVGVKDSGSIFPGHGGLLDRLDSMLFTLPFIYQAVIWYTRIAASQ